MGRFIPLTLIALVSFGLLWLKNSTFLSDALAFYDYHLTPAQEAAGYTHTYFDPNASNPSPEDVSYLFFKEAEYKTDPSCVANAAWCLHVIPMVKDCRSIEVRAETYATNSPSASTLEKLHSHVSPPYPRSSFQPGEVVTIGIFSRDNASKYASVIHATCG